jgi:hypothetical protein
MKIQVISLVNLTNDIALEFFTNMTIECPFVIRLVILLIPHFFIYKLIHGNHHLLT